MFGDYRMYLTWADELNKVSAASVQEAAQKTFVRDHSVAGLLLKEKPVAAKPAETAVKTAEPTAVKTVEPAAKAAKKSDKK